jgi:hemerythrin-like domain-containing protein
MHSLREEHALISQLLTLLSRECSELERDSRKALPLLREALQYLVYHTNVHHHPREEVLFEHLARRSPRHRKLRDALAREHESTVSVGEAKLRAVERAEGARALPAQELASLAYGIDRFTRELRDHILREEEILYSGAEQLLEPGDWLDLQSLRETPDPLEALDGKNAYPQLRAYFRESERRIHGSPLSTAEHLGVDDVLDRIGDRLAWMRRFSSMGSPDDLWRGVRLVWTMTLAASPWPWWHLMVTALDPGSDRRGPSPGLADVRTPDDEAPADPGDAHRSRSRPKPAGLHR